jgi:uncharacterized protein YbjT (DUF2867 family)
MRIFLAGATGLVGQRLLTRLCNSEKVTRVLSVGRRATGYEHPKLEELVGSLDQWPALIAEQVGDVAISTLGTTIADAGSQDAFYAIDHDAVLSFARATRAAGARQFLMVSSVGAHAASRNFYLAAKGRAEASIDQVGFQRLDILRPGLLRGRRTGRLRPGERVAIALSPLTDFLTPAVLSRYRSIPAMQVAGALNYLAGADESGIFVHHNEDMLAFDRRA